MASHRGGRTRTVARSPPSDSTVPQRIRHESNVDSAMPPGAPPAGQPLAYARLGAERAAHHIHQVAAGRPRPADLPRYARRRPAEPQPATFTIQLTPNRSVHMPNSSPHICLAKGIMTVPLVDSFSQ